MPAAHGGKDDSGKRIAVGVIDDKAGAVFAASRLSVENSVSVMTLELGFVGRETHSAAMSGVISPDTMWYLKVSGPRGSISGIHARNISGATP